MTSRAPMHSSTRGRPRHILVGQPPPPPPRTPTPTADTSRPKIKPTVSSSSNTPPTDETPPSPTQHTTLKRHLLGPSVLKPGQDNVDQSKVAEVIYEASKGSKYFANESRKDADLTRRINRITTKKAQLDKNPHELIAETKRADDFLMQLESTRDLTQTVLHVDCDAFYASVEELDRPELKKVPMAVGGWVLTTCNYEARKFGVRSGMAGHIAKKLCPQLVFVPMNFEKYNAKAKEVREVLRNYDERFEAASCDEAYLNITAFMKRNPGLGGPDEIVAKLRKEVEEHSKITVSAGIAPNARIAKICSNKNKPNGQFRVNNDRASVMTFMKTLPVRKVNGVGRVFERELEAVDIKTCGDIYPQRGYLLKLFGRKAYEFLLSVYLGLGRTNIQPAEEYIRKSIGTESSFPDCSGTENLRATLERNAKSLEEDLVKTELQGRTLALKIKMYTFEEVIRQKPLPFPIWKAQDLYDYALPLLTKLEQEYPDMRIRLMGLRLTSISSRKKTAGGVNFFRPIIGGAGKKRKVETEDKWEEWPEDEWEKYDEGGFQRGGDMEFGLEFDEKERDEDELKYFDGLNSDDLFAAEDPTDSGIDDQGSGKDTKKEDSGEDDEQDGKQWPCPICGIPQVADDRTFNDHVDFCLSRQTIREAVQEVHESERESFTPRPEASASPEKPTINAVFKEYKQVGNHKNPMPSKRGRPRGSINKRRKI